MTRVFSGFPAGVTAAVTLPEQVFSDIVPLCESLAELQVALIVLWRLTQTRSESAPWVTEAELHADLVLAQALGNDPATLEQALAHLVARGVLLMAEWPRADGQIERRYYANSPRGRAAVKALRRGVAVPKTKVAARPNIFTLYEENIGPLTALLRDELLEAERTYPPAWIDEAFREAVRRNKRSWRYIHAILERWRIAGKDEEDKRSRQRDRSRYLEGEYGDLIHH